MPASPLTTEVQALLDGFAWTTIDDVVAEVGLEYHYGIQGHGPIDTVASSGECTFALRNDQTNSGSTLGWYSPRHVNCRSGWRLGVPLRVRLTHAFVGVPIVAWSGKVASITPDGGAYRDRRVHVVAYDYMYDLMRSEIRELDLHINQTDRTLIDELLAVVPDSAQPLAIDLDDAFDSYPVVFDNLGGGQKAAAVLASIARSGDMMIFIDGTGTLKTVNRATRWTGETVVELLPNMIHDMTVSSDTSKSFNRFRITTHPKRVGSAPVVLFANDSPMVVYDGQTLEFWANYRDPADVRTPIGGADIITPLVSGTDYSGRPLPDGTGPDLTADLGVAVTPFASTAKVQIHNSAGQDVYLVNGAGQPLFQIRGTPIYDDGECVFEAQGDEDYGDSPFDVDMAYQADPTTGQAFANYYLATYRDPAPLDDIEIAASASDSLMLLAIIVTVGNRITVQESVSGVNYDVIVQSVRRIHDRNGVLFCRWGVATVPSGSFPAPAPPPVDINDTDLTMSYTGPMSGSFNLTTDGQLVLIPGDYSIAFNRLGASIRVRGIAAGEPGGPCDNSNGFGGAGGHSGASNLGGVVVPLTSLNWTARVGSSNTDPDVRAIVFRILDSTIVLQLTDTADVGAGGTDGELGGVPLELASGGAGGSGVTGGGGAGSAAGSPSTGGNGGDSSDQTGGTGGWAGGSPDGGDASPADANNAEPGTFGGGGFGGGAGGSALLGGVYAGGGGGGAGLGNGPFDGYGSGANGVMTIELA